MDWEKEGGHDGVSGPGYSEVVLKHVESMDERKKHAKKI